MDARREEEEEDVALWDYNNSNLMKAGKQGNESESLSSQTQVTILITSPDNDDRGAFLLLQLHPRQVLKSKPVIIIKARRLPFPDP